MKEKVVIITGAAGGLGRAFALGFASAGAKVVACDLNFAGAEETAAMVGEDALALKVDVADEASTEQMARTVVEKWGELTCWSTMPRFMPPFNESHFMKLPSQSGTW